MSPPNERHPMIAALEEVARRDDRATLAALRRALSAGHEASAYPFVARFFPREPDPWRERCLLLVASLFALHPSVGGVSLAEALRRVREATGSGSVEARFRALLDADREDLATHLRHALALARAHEIDVDYQDLLDAVRFWDSGRKRRAWARDFWAAAARPEPSQIRDANEQEEKKETER